MEVIEVERLVRKFGDLTAVNDISFAIEEEIFGFVGPNGAGKTTTINMLCTLLKPTSGRATVNGYDVVQEQAAVRRSIGLVFQEPSLDDRLTVEENLDFHAALYNVPRGVKKERMEKALRMVNLYDRRNDLVMTFSGGMKRRLEMARSLLHYPKVLLLDEPTLGLAPQTRNRIWEYILELREREGITIFMTTHYMDEAEYADRVAIIDYGRIVALDTPEKLKRVVGGDIISVKVKDVHGTARRIEERYGIEVRSTKDGLYFEVANGEEFIPGFVMDFKSEILAVSLRRPTLDDVFLKLTGRQIREEEVSGKERMLERMRWRRKRRS